MIKPLNMFNPMIDMWIQSDPIKNKMISNDRNINPQMSVQTHRELLTTYNATKNQKNNNNHNSSDYYDKKGLHPSRREA